MKTDNKIPKRFTQGLGQGESDDFVLPVAPPTPPSCIREEMVPTAPTNISGDPAHTPDFSFANPNRENEQCPQRSADERQEKLDGKNRIITESAHAWDNDTTVQTIPEITIDDSLIVAAVLIFISIGSTIFFGWIVFVEGLSFFLIPLLGIYAIAYDFFRKRMIRMALRQKHVDRIDSPH
jgi:hypothetical protein